MGSRISVRDERVLASISDPSKKLSLYREWGNVTVQDPAMVSDLPGSVVNRWLAWIRLFDFEVKHVSGVKHGGPDGLSRRERGKDSPEEMAPDEFDGTLDADLDMISTELQEYSAGFLRCRIPTHVMAVDAEWYEELVEFLTTMRRPLGKSDKEYRKIRQMQRSS